MKNSQHFHFSIAKRFADFGLFDKLKKHATDLYDDHTDTETYDDIFGRMVQIYHRKSQYRCGRHKDR